MRSLRWLSRSHDRWIASTQKLKVRSGLKRCQFGVPTVDMALCVRAGTRLCGLHVFNIRVRVAARFLPRKAFEHGSHHEKKLVSQPGAYGWSLEGGGVWLSRWSDPPVMTRIPICPHVLVFIFQTCRRERNCYTTVMRDALPSLLFLWFLPFLSLPRDWHRVD